MVLEWLRPIREHIAGVVYEAGPTGFDLVRRLQAEKMPVKVVAASKLPVARSVDSKSDRLDCRKLALYSAKGLVHPVRIPTAQEETDRQILRIRDQMIRKARTVQQQIKSFLLQHSLAEPKGLRYWSGAAIEALRGLELLPELRFCLDLLLDELCSPGAGRAGDAAAAGAIADRAASQGGREAPECPRGRAGDGHEFPPGATGARAVQ